MNEQEIDALRKALLAVILVPILIGLFVAGLWIVGLILLVIGIAALVTAVLQQ
ncbi:hypothetical protein RB199_34015 [Streptomyces libani]